MADRPKRYCKRWTQAEECKLARWYGKLSSIVIADKLDRTPVGVEYHAALMGLTSTQGTVSLRSFVETTGYSPDAIKAVAAKEGIILRRAPRTIRYSRAHPKNRRIALSYDDQERITAGLRNLDNPNRVPGSDQFGANWGENGLPPECACCKRSDRRPHGRCLCSPCYTRLRRANQLDLYPPRQRILRRRHSRKRSSVPEPRNSRSDHSS